MDQRYLEYILVLAETGNMTRAAQKLYISQPTLSQFLSKQEEKIGTALFQRSEGVYKLTSVGELYAEYARKILELTDELERDIKRISATIRINIGNSASRSLEMLTSILTDFRKQYPKAELMMTDCNVHKEETLFAVSSSHPYCRILEQDSSYCLTSKELLEHFGDSPFILQPQGSCIRNLLNSFFETHKFNPTVLFSTTYARSILDMVGSNLGSGFATESPAITYFSLAPKMYRVHYILYREEPWLEAPCRLLIKLAQQYVEHNW